MKIAGRWKVDSARDIYCRKFVLKYNAFLVIYKQMRYFCWIHFWRLRVTYWANSVIQDPSVLILLLNSLEITLLSTSEPGNSTRLEDFIFKDS